MKGVSRLIGAGLLGIAFLLLASDLASARDKDAVQAAFSSFASAFQTSGFDRGVERYRVTASMPETCGLLIRDLTLEGGRVVDGVQTFIDLGNVSATSGSYLVGLGGFIDIRVKVGTYITVGKSTDGEVYVFVDDVRKKRYPFYGPEKQLRRAANRLQDLAALCGVDLQN